MLRSARACAPGCTGGARWRCLCSHPIHPHYPLLAFRVLEEPLRVHSHTNNTKNAVAIRLMQKYDFNVRVRIFMRAGAERREMVSAIGSAVRAGVKPKRRLHDNECQSFCVFPPLGPQSAFGSSFSCAPLAACNLNAYDKTTNCA